MEKTPAMRRNAVIAACAAAMLLIGGSSYALWSASDTTDGGTITAGDLDIKVSDTAGYWDMSQDRLDGTGAVKVPTVDGQSTVTLASLTGHAIDTLGSADQAGWEIVPGDMVAVTVPVEMTLQGDNLVAQLTTDLSVLTDNAKIPPMTNMQYAVYDNQGNAIINFTSLPTSLDKVDLGLYQAPNAGQSQGQKDGDIPFVNAKDKESNTGDEVMVLMGTFDASTAGQSYVGETLMSLGDVPFSLEQVRCTGEVVSQFNTYSCPAE